MSTKQKQDYSETLLQCSMPRKFISACPVAFGETGVKQRIKGILNYRRPTAWVAVLSLLVCMFAAAFFLTDPVQAETTPKEIPAIENEPYRGAAVYITHPLFKLTMYSAPSESSHEIAVFGEGEKIYIQREEKVGNATWVYGISEDETVSGWVKMAEDLPETTPTEEPTFHIGAAVYSTHPLFKLTMYSAPSESSHEIAVFGEGEKIYIQREEKIGNATWVYGISEDETVSGWVKMAEDLPEEQQSISGNRGMVNSNGDTRLNVRSAPGLHSPVVDSLENGDAVDILETVVEGNQQWGRIGDDRWVCMTYITMAGAPTNTTATAMETVNVFSSPSHQARTLGTLEAGDEVTILRTENIANAYWYYISTETLMGWVETDLLATEPVG